MTMRIAARFPAFLVCLNLVKYFLGKLLKEKGVLPASDGREGVLSHFPVDQQVHTGEVEERDHSRAQQSVVGETIVVMCLEPELVIQF